MSVRVAMRRQMGWRRHLCRVIGHDIHIKGVWYNPQGSVAALYQDCSRCWSQERILGEDHLPERMRRK